MKTLTIHRVAHHEDGTFGVILDDGTPFAVTVEPEWKDNQANISCIPSGVYVCERVNSPRWGDTFTVLDVPGRSYIRFHRGNTEDSTEGCICVAEEFGTLNHKTAVLRSNHEGKGIQEFFQRTEGLDRFQLVVLAP